MTIPGEFTFEPEYDDYNLPPALPDGDRELLPATNGIQLDTMRFLVPTDAPRLLGYGAILAIEVGQMSITGPAKPEMRLVVSGGTVILNEYAIWGSSDGQSVRVFVFEWNQMHFAAAVKGDRAAAPTRRREAVYAAIWGPFSSVEAAHKVVDLL